MLEMVHIPRPDGHAQVVHGKQGFSLNWAYDDPVICNYNPSKFGEL